MSIDLCTTVPKWAPVGAPLEIGFLLVNRGREPMYVNARCACGHPGSGADIAIEVIDRHGRAMRSRRSDVPPPSRAHFVWLPPGQRAYGNIYDVLDDFELPVGRYTLRFTYRVVDAIPPELRGQPVFTDMILTDEKSVDVILWGVAPPRSKRSAR